MSYAPAPLGFWQLLTKCFSGYIPVYKKAWQLIVAFALLTFVYSLLVYNQSHLSLLMLSLILFFLIATFINAAILNLGNAALTPQSSSIPEAFQVARHQYGSFLACYFVLMVAVMFMAIFFKLAFFLLASLVFPDMVANTPLAQIPAWWASVFIVFGIMFLIISIFFYLAPLIVIIEKQNAATALKQSADRVKGHWWRVFGVLLVVYIIVGAIFLGLNLVMFSNHPVVLSLQDVIVQLIIYPLPIATGLTLLNDLRLRMK